MIKTVNWVFWGVQLRFYGREKWVKLNCKLALNRNWRLNDLDAITRPNETISLCRLSLCQLSLSDLSVSALLLPLLILLLQPLVLLSLLLLLLLLQLQSLLLLFFCCLSLIVMMEDPLPLPPPCWVTSACLRYDSKEHEVDLTSME